MTDATIEKSIFFAASRETVWAFLTDKDKLGMWFYQAEADLAEGNDYMLIQINDDGGVDKKCWGEVLELDAPSRLVYTFTFGPLAGKTTTVIWTLEEVQGGTKLSLEHQGIGEAAGEMAMGLLTALDAGWDRHLAGLRSAAG